jgi:hypothetical protein
MDGLEARMSRLLRCVWCARPIPQRRPADAVTCSTSCDTDRSKAVGILRAGPDQLQAALFNLTHGSEITTS